MKPVFVFLSVFIFIVCFTSCSAEKTASALIRTLPQAEPVAEPVPGPAEEDAPAQSDIRNLILDESFSGTKGNAYPVKSFDTATQSFYYRFPSSDALDITLYIDAEMSACESDPTKSFSLIDISSGKQVTVLQLNEQVKVVKPAGEHILLKVTFGGLSSCMMYGGSFSVHKN